MYIVFKKCFSSKIVFGKKTYSGLFFDVESSITDHIPSFFKARPSVTLVARVESYLDLSKIRNI